MNISKFLKDKVTLVKEDGTTHENVTAGVQSELIFVDDASLPIEVGDKIKRKLPSGVEETFVVTAPNFYERHGGIPAHYQIKYRRDDVASQGHPGNVPLASQGQSGTVNINVTGGDNTRVNFGSVDQSINVSKSEAGATFDQARELVREQVADATERGRLLEKIDQMEQSHGTPGFSQAYKNFIAVAADHAAVLGPVLGVLALL